MPSRYQVELNKEDYEAAEILLLLSQAPTLAQNEIKEPKHPTKKRRRNRGRTEGGGRLSKRLRRRTLKRKAGFVYY